MVVLQQFFQTSDIEKDYDYILFDCPPSNNVITQGAFLLSDYYIIPTIVQTISIRGVVHYIKTVEAIYKKYCVEDENAALAKLLFGPRPKLIGIFETLKKGSVKNHKELQNLMGDLQLSGFQTLLSVVEEGKFIFDTIIRNYEDISRDTAKGKKCLEYADLTDELLDCLEPTGLIVT